jgi:hypothetical protein
MHRLCGALLLLRLFLVVAYLTRSVKPDIEAGTTLKSNLYFTRNRTDSFGLASRIDSFEDSQAAEGLSTGCRLQEVVMPLGKDDGPTY